MSVFRILLPPVVPDVPGTLESLTISLYEVSGPVQEPILRFALEKWTSLYTIRVLSYSISERSVVLLAFVPAESLGEEEARERCKAFDNAQKARCARLCISHGNYKPHRWPGSKLRDLSHFMGVFTQNLGLLHKYIPEELQRHCKNLRPLLFRGRFKRRTVSNEAAPGGDD